MGPRSDNRGYATVRIDPNVDGSALQWVHGPITVVMQPVSDAHRRIVRLQWVHGPITVVMTVTLDCHDSRR